MIVTKAARLILLRRFVSGLELALYARESRGEPVEVVAPEYAPIQILEGEWVVDEDAETAALPTKSWTFMHDIGQVAGYFARYADGVVAFSDAFAKPVTVNRPGDQILVQPTVAYFGRD